MKQKRNTNQKNLIISEIENIDSFFTAEDIHSQIKKKNPHIGIATVYRFLKELKKDGKLYSYQCNRKTTYSKENKSHCHFICESTGKVTHFNIDSLDFLKDKIPGTIKSFQIEVRGICKGKCNKCEGKN